MSEEPQKQAPLIERTFLKFSPSLKYWGFRVASKLAKVVPLKVSYGISVVVGDYIYYTWHEHSGNAISNMRRVLGKGSTLTQAKSLARDSFRNYAKSLVDFIRMPYVTPAEVNARVDTGGWEKLEAARSTGKGVLAVSGHIGNWDFAGAVLGLQKLPLHAIADTLEPPRLNDLIISTRERNGIHILPLGPAALRSMLQALKKDEMVLLLMDRPMNADDGVRVTFFGEEAYLPSGPAAIVLKSGASLLSGALVRLPGDYNFTGDWEEIPYKHLITGNKDADIQAITQQIANALEKVISQNPDQWYMFRPMWSRVDVSRHTRRQEKQAQLPANGSFSLDGQAPRKLRIRLRPRRGRMDIAAMGISVDPPDMEHWLRGDYLHPAQAAPNTRRKRSRIYRILHPRKSSRALAPKQADKAADVAGKR